MIFYYLLRPFARFNLESSSTDSVGVNILRLFLLSIKEDFTPIEAFNLIPLIVGIFLADHFSNKTIGSANTSLTRAVAVVNSIISEFKNQRLIDNKVLLLSCSNLNRNKSCNHRPQGFVERGEDNLNLKGNPDLLDSREFNIILCRFEHLETVT